jgi:integrase
MGLFKRGKVWHIKIRWKGKLIRRSTGARSKETARIIEAEIIDRLAKNRWGKEELAETILFRDVWEKYMREEGKYKSNGTYKRALQSAKNFLTEIGELTLSQVTSGTLSDYKTKRLESGVTISTVVKELQFIRRVFSLCKREWQLTRQSPFEFFRMPTVNDQRVRFLEPGQFDQLLFKCPDWLKPMVMLARFTGLRRGNILNLTWSQVDLQQRVINLEHTKNGQRLTIPLCDTSYNVLVGLKDTKVIHLDCPFVFYQNGKPFSPYQVSMAFKRACKRAEVKNFRFHDLRHDFASHLIQRGNDLYIVQNLLGHKDGRMTQRYAHLRVENLREAVESLERGHKNVHNENKKGVTCAATP